MKPAAGEPWSLQDSLLACTADPVASALLARLPDSALPLVAEDLVGSDVFRCGTITRRALLQCGSHGTLACDHVEHLLWCAWRTARWTCGVGEEHRESWRIEGPAHLAEVESQPTVVLAPMTLPLCEVGPLLGGLFPRRDVVLYGRGMEGRGVDARLPLNLRFYGDGLASLRDIVAALRRGGVYCTYPDFVYTGHETLAGTLFGTPRAYSSSFISICAQPGVHILPIRAWRCAEGRVVRVGEPLVLEVRAQQQNRGHRTLLKRAVLDVLVRVLEASIAERPEQWLLLGTLAAEAVEAAQLARS